MAPGTYYIAGYMYDGAKTFTFSHLDPGNHDHRGAPETFAVLGPTSGTYQAGQTINIPWTAGGVVAGSTISLCYDTDTTFNGNEHWIEIDAVTAADGRPSVRVEHDRRGAGHVLPRRLYVRRQGDSHLLAPDPGNHD